jgi:hypothetical protein
MKRSYFDIKIEKDNYLFIWRISMAGKLMHQSLMPSLNAFFTHLICQIWASAIFDSLECWSIRWRTDLFDSRKPWRWSWTIKYSKTSSRSYSIGWNVLIRPFNTRENIILNSNKRSSESLSQSKIRQDIIIFIYLICIMHRFGIFLN